MRDPCPGVSLDAAADAIKVLHANKVERIGGHKIEDLQEAAHNSSAPEDADRAMLILRLAANVVIAQGGDSRRKEVLDEIVRVSAYEHTRGIFRPDLLARSAREFADDVLLAEGFLLRTPDPAGRSRIVGEQYDDGRASPREFFGDDPSEIERLRSVVRDRRAAYAKVSADLMDAQEVILRLRRKSQEDEYLASEKLLQKDGEIAFLRRILGVAE